MASGHVNRIKRPDTWLHRPSLRREDFSCQPGAVHTWRKAAIRENTASQVLNPLHGWAAKRGDSGRSGCEVGSHRRPRGRRISLRGFCSRRRARYDSRGADEAELLQGRYPIVTTDFLEDLYVLEFQHGRAGEFHLAAGVGRQRSRQEVAERLPGMRSAAFPSTDDVVAFRDEIRSAPEVEIGERFPKVRHERLDVFMATARFVERILQEHVGRGEFIDNSEVASLAPKIREPPANNGLVVFFL